MTSVLERGEHGVTGWRLGCRCATCHRALLDSARVWWATRRVRRGADPATRVPVARARRHVGELLAAGRTVRSIAADAQVAPSTVSRIMQPDTRRVSRLVARAVLAVEP